MFTNTTAILALSAVFPPFRIVGNVYRVGSYDLSTYLITTPRGHIPINTGIGDTAEQIKKSVEALGFWALPRWNE